MAGITGRGAAIIFDKIIPRLLLGFLLLSPLPLAGLAWLHTQAFERALEAEDLASLSAIADKKADQINAYVNERLVHSRLLAKLAVIWDALETLPPLSAREGTASPRYRAEEQRYRDYFRTLFDSVDYYDLLLSDAAGNVVLSILHEPDFGSNLNTGPYRDSTLANAHREAIAMLDTQITPARLYAPSGGKPAIFIVTPVLKAGKVVGTVALQLNLDRLTAVTSDTTGLGQSGETVLAQRDGAQALYVGPLRHVPDAAFRYRVPLEKVALPMQAALAGEHAQGVTQDYAGVGIAGAWRHLPALSWGMVVKIDTSEAFAPAHQLRKYTLAALGLLLLAAGLAALLFGRALVAPIRQLTLATRQIVAGDLSRRAPVEGPEETRQLAQSFNLMADRILEEQATLEQRVTERTRELQESKVQYEELTARIPVGVYSFLIRADGSMAFEYVSARFCDILDLPAEAILADASAAFAKVHPDDLDAFVRLNQEAARTLQPFQWEGRFVIRGETRWLLIESSPIPQANGDSLWNGVMRDTTERKKMEQALRQERDFAAGLVNTAPVIVLLLDTQGIIEYVNPYFEQITGYRLDEVMGKEWFRTFLPARDQERVRALFQKAIHDEPTRGNISPIVTRGGEELEIEWYDQAMRDAQGLVTSLLATGQDVTTRRANETALIEAKLAAEAASKAKSEFLANMSHEIRTPMNAVLGLTQLVLDTDLTHQQRDFLKKAHTSAYALLDVLNDILDFSKIEAGRMGVEQVPFRLEEPLNHVADLFGTRIEEKGLELSFDVAPDAPEEVLGDPLRLAQVLTNLVSNAVKFTEHGAISVKVEVAERNPATQRLRFSVRDTGIGLSRAQSERLFQAFTQADGTTTRKYGGAGLGLSICQRLVGLMGGEISVSSVEGQGSTFVFTIQAGVASPHGRAQPPTEADARAETAASAPCLQGMRILLVEDNELNQQVAAEFLKQRGALLTLANHGAEAVERVGSGTFDAVLMDLYMPVMDGFEATRRIRELPQGGALPIIAMTAAVLQEDRDRCAAAGIADFIAKPINPEEMARVLLKWAKTDPDQNKQIKTSALHHCPQIEASALYHCPFSPWEKVGMRVARKRERVGVRAAPLGEGWGEGSPSVRGDGVLPASMPGFDLEMALQRLDGNRGLLARLLRSFAGKQSGALAQLEELVRAGDSKAAAILLHTLKGTAATLGAVALAEAARLLELEVKAGGEPSALPGFAATFNATLDAIRTRLAPARSTAEEPAIDRQALAQVLNRLTLYLQERELVPVDLMESLHHLARSDFPDKSLARLVRQVDHFDHDGALASVAQLAAIQGVTLGGEEVRPDANDLS